MLDPSHACTNPTLQVLLDHTPHTTWPLHAISLDKLSPALLVDMAVLDEVGLVGFSDEDGSTGSDDVGRIVVLLGHSVQLTTHRK